MHVENVDNCNFIFHLGNKILYPPCENLSNLKSYKFNVLAWDVLLTWSEGLSIA